MKRLAAGDSCFEGEGERLRRNLSSAAEHCPAASTAARLSGLLGPRGW
jgi:hypothetical protein